MLIKKASGAIESFQAGKLKASLLKAGATTELAEHIVNQVEETFKDVVETKRIYRMAFGLLKKHSNQLAGRYHLKRAIMDLGPSGYPFEKYVAALLNAQGYQTQVGIMIRGKCITHEVDVVAEKTDQHFMVECKFHNHPGTKSDVKVPLYIRSRFEDVRHSWVQLPGHKAKFHQGWVVTNTRFTQDAIDYGKCSGLKLIGWDYPANGSLNERINLAGLHPLTCITGLSKAEKKTLLKAGVVLCRELCEQPELLYPLDMSPRKIKAVLKEAHGICIEHNTIGI